MTVKGLIEMLEDCDPNAQIRLAYQPNYPMYVDAGQFAEVNGFVYIGQGTQDSNDYLPEGVAEELNY